MSRSLRPLRALSARVRTLLRRRGTPGEALFDAFFVRATDLLCIIGPDGEIVRANPAFAALTGVMPEAMQGRAFVDFIHPDDRATAYAEATRLRAGESTTNPVCRFTAADGEWRVLALTAGVAESDALFVVGRDVTDQRRLEEERAARVRAETVAREREKFRAIYDASLDVCSVWEPLCDGSGAIADFALRHCNAGYAALLGITQAELTGARLTTLSSNVRESGRFAIYRDVFESGVAREHEMHDDASGRWYRVMIVRAGDALAITATDVTTQREAEVVLRRTRDELEAMVVARTAETRESELRFRGAFEHSAIGFALVGLDGAWLRVNRSLCRIVGYTREELLGRSFQDITHPEDLRADLDHVARLVAGEIESYEMEKRYLRKDGTAVLVLLSVSLVRDAEGAPQYFISQIQDIDARHRAEREVERQRDRLAAVVEIQQAVSMAGLELDAVMKTVVDAAREVSHGDAAVVELPDGDAMVYRAAGGTAASHAGMRLPIATSLSGQCLRSGETLVCDDTESDPRVNRDACRRVGARSMIVVPLLADDGHVLGVLKVYSGRPSLFGQEAVATLRLLAGLLAAAIGRSLTFEAEQALVAELARSNEELERFAYVASHDLQEPLRMVASFTQLLQRRYAGRLDDQADEYIAFAVDGASRMQRLIRDLLEYSRVGRRGRPPAPVDADVALDRALANLGVAAAEAQATVTHDRLPTVLADETQLVQVLQNLVGNAIKFSGGDGARVHVSATDVGSMWALAVHDEGIGVAPANHERIFHLFQRLHGREAYEGTGLGLSICKKIVERHGGRIWVESEEGRGATFAFTLPKAPADRGALRGAA